MLGLYLNMRINICLFKIARVQRVINKIVIQ